MRPGMNTTGGHDEPAQIGGVSVSVGVAGFGAGACAACKNAFATQMKASSTTINKLSIFTFFIFIIPYVSYVEILAKSFSSK